MKHISRKRSRKLKRQRANNWLNNCFRMAAENILVTHEPYTDLITGIPMRWAVMRNKLTEGMEEIYEVSHHRSGTLSAGMIIKSV